jgi:DNA-binding transcriptional LysR family regulator
MLELRQLRYFVGVAEQEHVGRAAELLHISQSPLSRQIMAIEAELGLQLFERHHQRLRLTPEGREFLAEAREVLARAGKLEQRGRLLGAGMAGSLSVGYVEAAVHSGLLARSLRPLRQGRPDLQLHLSAQRSAEQLDGLRQRLLDIGFVYTPPAADDGEIASCRVLDEPLLLALPADDRLADGPPVTPADLDGRAWVTVVRRPPDTNRAPFLAACSRAGFMPVIAYETTEPLASLELVAAGLAFATVQASLRKVAPPAVAFRELPWFDRRVAVHLVWRRRDERASIRAFRDAATGVSPRDGRDGR